MIKIRFLDQDIGNYRYRQKCGVDPATYLISSLGSSVLSGAASIFGQQEANDANMESLARQMAFQREENEKQRVWQREENATNRQFESEQAEIARSEQNRYWHEQFDTSSAEWYNQQNRVMQNWYEQQAYNSPANQVARARAAGFNPSAVSNQGGLQDSSVILQSPSVPSVSMPSGSIPSGSSTGPSLSGSPSAIPMQNTFSGVADMLRSIGSFVGELSKADVDQTFKNDSLNVIRENWKSLQLKNRVDAVSAFVAEQTKDTKVNQIMQEYANTIMMYDIMGVEFDEKQQNILNIKEDRLLTRAKRFMNDEQLKQLKDLFPYVRKDLISTINAKNAQAVRDRESAGLIHEQFVSQEFWNQLNSEQRDTLVRSMVLDVEQKTEALGLTSEQANLARLMSEKAQKDVDYYTARFWNDAINQYLRTGVDIFGEFTKFKSFKALGEIQQQKVRNDMRQLELREQELNRRPANKKHEHFNSKGQLTGFDWVTYD